MLCFVSMRVLHDSGCVGSLPSVQVGLQRHGVRSAMRCSTAPSYLFQSASRAGGLCRDQVECFRDPSCCQTPPCWSSADAAVLQPLPPLLLLSNHLFVDRDHVCHLQLRARCGAAVCGPSNTTFQHRAVPLTQVACAGLGTKLLLRALALDALSISVVIAGCSPAVYVALLLPWAASLALFSVRRNQIVCVRLVLHLLYSPLA